MKIFDKDKKQIERILALALKFSAIIFC